MDYNLTDIKLVVFDLDGVIYKDEIPLKGSEEIIKYLKENKIQYCFFTNNSSYEPHIYTDRLLKCGIEVNEDQIITTAKLADLYIQTQKYKDIYVLGSEALKKRLYKSYEKNKFTPEAIVIGMDNDISFGDVSKVINMIDSDCEIIATNPDMLIPTSKGFDLECGVIIDIIERFGKKRVKVLGKPNQFGFTTIFEFFQCEPQNSLMIGDTYETDILGALQSKMKAGWIATGNKLPKDLKEKDFYRFENLADIVLKFKKASKL